MPSRRARKSPGASRKRHPWAFKGAKYLAVKDINRNGVSTGVSVDALREALGLRPGVFDAQTRDKVMEAQARAGLPVTGVVTEPDWDAIVNATRGRRKPPAGATPPVD